MKILGLTGSIGMGKSTACAMLRGLGVPVHDSDAAVHRFLGKKGAAVDAVAKAFPGTLKAGAIDRKALGALVFADPAGRKKLEAILHPMVRAAQERFLKRHRARGCALVALDIPLLFETGAEARCDAVAVVSAPKFLQNQRVLGRKDMSKTRLDAIRATQMPDAEKRRRADWVVPTGQGKRATLSALRRIVGTLRAT
jgi:dephospho-CoA kinase